jgi:transposase-like protein
MKASEQNLTHKQEQAIMALLSETTIAAAAEKVGIGEATLHRWLKLDAFREAYRAARRDTVEKAMALIQNSTWAAATTLVRLLGSSSDSVKLRAAQALLDQASKGLETLDFEERLLAVEQFAKDMDGK